MLQLGGLVPLSTEESLVKKRDLLALYLSGTYCHKTGTRPPSCVAPRQPTINNSRTKHKKLRIIILVLQNNFIKVSLSQNHFVVSYLNNHKVFIQAFA